MANKSELIAALRSTADDAATKLRALDPTTLDEGRYENGWSGRQILAHIASIEWTYPRLIEVARSAPAADETPAPGGVRRTEEREAPGLPTNAARGGIDDYNARQVEKRADKAPGELVEELLTNRQATIAAVEAVDDELLQRPIRSAGGITGTLGDVLMAVAVQHVQGHVADITGTAWDGQRW